MKKNRLRMSLAIASSMLLATATASALATERVGPAKAAAAPSPVLYNQTTGTPGALLPRGPAADDFVVPPGPTWVVDGATLMGEGSGTTGASIFPDAGGVPGVESIAQEYERGPAVPGGRAISFGAGVPLQPGKYWISSRPVEGQWAWRAQSPQVGSEAGLIGFNHDCPDPNAAFRPVSACGQPGPDLQFAINGEYLSNQFTLGKARRERNGGVSIRAVFPHSGEVVFGGPGLKRKTKQPHFAPKQGGYAQTMNFVPTAAVKKALTAGARRRTTAFVTYTPFAGAPGAGAPAERRFKLLLRR